MLSFGVSRRLDDTLNALKASRADEEGARGRTCGCFLFGAVLCYTSPTLGNAAKLAAGDPQGSEAASHVSCQLTAPPNPGTAMPASTASGAAPMASLSPQGCGCRLCMIGLHQVGRSAGELPPLLGAESGAPRTSGWEVYERFRP